MRRQSTGHTLTAASTAPRTKRVFVAGILLGWFSAVLVAGCVLHYHPAVESLSPSYSPRQLSPRATLSAITTPQPLRFRVQLLSIVDGDTIRILWHSENTKVRLLGIDAPERNQPGYDAATDALRNLLGANEWLELEFPGGKVRRDSFGRLLAIPWVDGINCCDALLQQGLVKRYSKKT